MKYLKLFEQFDFEDDEEEDDEIYAEMDKFFDNLKNRPSIDLYKFVAGDETYLTRFYVNSIRSSKEDKNVIVRLYGYISKIFDLQNKNFSDIDEFYNELSSHEDILKISTYHGASFGNDCHFHKDEWEKLIEELKVSYAPFREDIEALPKCYPIDDEELKSLNGKSVEFFSYTKKPIYVIQNVIPNMYNKYLYHLKLKGDGDDELKNEDINDIEMRALLDTGVCDLETKLRIV